MQIIDIDNEDEMELYNKWLEIDLKAKPFKLRLKTEAPKKYEEVFENVKKRYIENRKL